MNPSVLAASLIAIVAPASTPLADDFRHGLARWRVEAQVPARVEATGGVLEIDAREGVTIWLKRSLHAPVRVAFDAMAIASEGGGEVASDVNAFWMAHEAGGGAPRPRRGTFEDYDTLRTYYVGIGGNRNTSTRMRRYVGRAGVRPLLPEHDRSDAAALLSPNVWTHVELIADRHSARVIRDGCVLFTMDDRAPYVRGWFGLRTTRSHLIVRQVRIDAHVDVSHTPHCPAPPPSPGPTREPVSRPAAAAF